MSIRQNGKIIAGATQYHPDLFDHKWADHILNDVSWLRADTFSWQDGGVYEAAYNHLTADISGKSLQSETVAGTTVQFYLADDGHKICPASEESNVLSIYNATGVAWYYIIDTTNQRFKLPRTKFGFTGIRSGVGGFVEAGLPNITGSVTAPRGLGRDGLTATGAFAVSGSAEMANTISYYNENTISLDASNSSSIYGNSDTVQPKATEMYLYFYVGNFTQTALENTAGVTTETLNQKADVDLSNINNQGKDKAASWFIPDTESAIAISSFPYTAPADGFVETNSSIGQWTDTNLKVNGITVSSYKNPTNITGFNIVFSSFVNKGGIVSGTNLTSGTFYPFKR